MKQTEFITEVLAIAGLVVIAAILALATYYLAANGGVCV